MDGIILINKPEGFTSFDVIAKLRGILKMKRIGHSGTLDPMATGVLPVFLGKSTKAVDILPNSEKSYRASFSFGTETDTEDSSGTVIKTFETKVSKDDILNTLDNFRGDIMQTPPMYSAVSVGGKRLYELARQGIVIEREARQITVNELELISFDEKTQTGFMKIDCSKGTYIRTIISDVARSLGTGGIMTGLTRTTACGYSLDKCLTLDEVQSLMDKGEIENKITPIDTVFESYPEIHLCDKQTSMYKNGIKLDTKLVDIKNNDSEIYRIYSFDNAFLGLGRVEKENEILRVFKNFF